MANYYSIKIPKPCHEGWDTMSPKDKGRFCSSCSKTVVDFTKMDTNEIQGFLLENKDKRICGHIKQTQLDSINIRIPLSLIQQNHNVYKSFFLAVMIVMGTSLFNCNSKNGKPQKIDSIEVIDSTKNEVVDFLGGIISHTETDSIIQNELIPPPINVVGDIITVEGDMLIEEHLPTEPYSIYEIDEFPKFKETASKLSKEESKKQFQYQLNQFVIHNFNKAVSDSLGLKGKQRIYVDFEITNTGNIIIKRSRAYHPELEKEAERILKELPKFIPARKDEKAVSVTYILPIVFNIEIE